MTHQLHEDKKLKSVCFLTENMWKEAQGGAELQIELQKDYLRTLGYKVNHIYLSRMREHEEFINGDLTIAIRRNHKLIDASFGDCRLQYFTRIYAQLNRLRPDVIIHRDLSSLALPAIYFAKKRNAQVLVQIAHQKDVEPLAYTLLKNPLAGHFERMARSHILLTANTIVAQASYQNDLLLKNFGRKNGHVMRNVYPSTLTAKSHDRARTSQFYVYWIANFKEWKRPELFVEIAERLVQQPEIKFVMIGRPKKSKWGDELLARIARCSNLSYLGELSLEEVNAHLERANVFVNTSTFEGFPNTFIQSWLKEVPVISLGVDPDGCLTDFGLGKVCRTTADAVSTLQQFESNRQLTYEIGRKCFNHALKMHSRKNFDLLESLIGYRNAAN